MNKPFIEKYKPTNIDELILDNIIRIELKSFIENKNIPNVIFYGNTGSGKTLSIQTLIKSIYHPKNLNAVIEFNASDERGIKINDDILKFIKIKINFREGYCQKKLFVFEEADNFTDKTQQLINSNIEKNPNISFCFTCTNLNKILESIQSRCIIINFTNLNEIDIKNRLNYICLNEQIIHNDEALLYLIRICKKDLRVIINLLEAIYYTENEINIENIQNVMGIPFTILYDNLLTSILSKNKSDILEDIKKLRLNGYDSLDVLTYFIDYIFYNNELDNDNKIHLLNHLSKNLIIMNKTINNYLQLTKILLNTIE